MLYPFCFEIFLGILKISNFLIIVGTRYDERIDRVETRITAKLRDQLGTARNANEMFRIFSRFNALFIRPHIRGAIREYQTQLIQRVKDDIEALHEKFKVTDNHIESVYGTDKQFCNFSWLHLVLHFLKYFNILSL